MEKPHHRRHPKLHPTERRKTSYENGAKRRMNNTVPKQFEPLTSPNSPVALLSIAKQISGPPNQMPEWWHTTVRTTMRLGVKLSWHQRVPAGKGARLDRTRDWRSHVYVVAT